MDHQQFKIIEVHIVKGSFECRLIDLFTTKWKSWSTCPRHESEFRITQRSSSESHHLGCSWRCVLDHVSCQSIFLHLQWLGIPRFHWMRGNFPSRAWKAPTPRKSNGDEWNEGDGWDECVYKMRLGNLRSFNILFVYRQQNASRKTGKS